jgi:threonine synthase
VVCLVTGSGLKDTASVRKASAEPAIVEPSLDAVSKACKSIF